MLSLFFFALAASCVIAATVSSLPPPPPPIVKLSYGSFQGNTTGDIKTFLGMPYAAPPVGSLRYSLAQPPLYFNGIKPATSYGAACPQVFPSNTSVFPISEDCLFINVVAPASILPGLKLPVLFVSQSLSFAAGYISRGIGMGSGLTALLGVFATGDPATTPGNTIVQRSIDLDEPIIYVSLNYRLNVFGFLGGQEIQSAGVGNLGLQDQRFAMSWVQQHISAFGGDPYRVTISGESAGSISVGFQLIAENGNDGGLFHGAFMSSGSPYSINNISAGQTVYNELANSTGCLQAANTLSCLRSVPFTTIMNTLTTTLQAASWAPMIDGNFLKLNPWQTIKEGLYAKVPLVSGDVDDEGTVFAIKQLGITTDAQFENLVSTTFLPGINQDQLNAVLQAYPSDVTQGSPYDTGDSNALTPEYKRLASIEGDLLFQMPRRYLLAAASRTQLTWSFLDKRGKSTPNLGSYHASNVPEIYGTATVNDYILTDAFINFVNTLNPTEPPNKKSFLTTSGVSIHWTPWGSSKSEPPLLTLLDTSPNLTITADTYRQEPIALLMNITLSLQLP